MEPGVFAVMLSATQDALHEPSSARESVTGNAYVMMKHLLDAAAIVGRARGGQCVRAAGTMGPTHTIASSSTTRRQAPPNAEVL
jgi:hypothetical protein